MKIIVVSLLSLTALFARSNASGWCEQGNQNVMTNGKQSSTKVQRSYPSCTVTVTLLGGGSFSIYSDNSGTLIGTGTSVAFTSNNSGLWSFFADANHYVVTLSGSGISSPFSINVSVPSDTGGGGGGGVTSLDGMTGVLTNATGTAGSDFNIVDGGGVITFNFPTASGTFRGLLSSADWTTFNSKQGALVFSAPLVNTAGTVALTLPLTIGQGGHGQITQTAGFNALSPLTTKGDLICFNGTNNVRLAVGADGLALVADSSQGCGFRWASGGGGGSSAFSAVTSGTNTAAAMLVGSGASFGPTGTGTINATKVVDSSQVTVLDTTATASAVNKVTVVNGATGSPGIVKVQATGTDTDINLELDSKGAGGVTINQGSGTAGSDDYGAGTAAPVPSNSVGWGAPTTVTTSVRLVFPNALPTGNSVLAFPAPTSNVSIGAYATLPSIQSCGTTSTCSATAINGGQIVKGSAPLVSGTPSTVTISGISPAFTSSTSYVCTVSAQSAAGTALLSVANVSSSSFTITGPNTDTRVVNYICGGN